MLRTESTALQFEQTRFPFEDESSYQQAQTPSESLFADQGFRVSQNSAIPRVSTRKEYQTFLFRVKPLSGEAEGRIKDLSAVVQQSFEQRRNDNAGFILNKFSDSLIDFWERRYSQYSSTERFIKRVAKVFNLTPVQVRVIQQYWNLPNCIRQTTRTLDINRFATCLYLDQNETVRDPLDNYYTRTVTKASTLHAWDHYLDAYAFLTPDMLDPSDIRYLLKKYAMPIERAAMLLQVRACELADFAEDINCPVTYQTSAVPIRDLIGHYKHERLTKIVLGCAHSLYTHQAIPLRIIAERIGMDVGMLFEQGEKVIGDWIQPQLNTIHHVIEITTLLHVEGGGVLRQNAS